MEDEQYCLKWNNHQSTLVSVFSSLMTSEKLSDCILAAEGKTMRAHQVVISACSPYLERLLDESRLPGSMPILVFSDITYEELLAMKEYMYKGEVNIRQDGLDSFLKAAGTLQVKGLADGADEGRGSGKRKAPGVGEVGGGAPPGRRRRRGSNDLDHSMDQTLPQPLPQPLPAPIKKQNVFTTKSDSSYEAPPEVKMEPVMMDQGDHHPQVQMKPEPLDHPEPETHDLTGLDDEEDYDYDMPGTSQPDLAQDISNWQMDNSMQSVDDFAASQSLNASQGGTPQQGSQAYGRYTCLSCGSSYRNKCHLSRHQKFECSNIKMFTCPHCSFSSKRKDNLKRHTAIVHFNIL